MTKSIDLVLIGLKSNNVLMFKIMEFDIRDSFAQKAITSNWLVEQYFMETLVMVSLKNKEFVRLNQTITETIRGITIRPLKTNSSAAWEEHGKLIERADKKRQYLN